MTPRDLELNKPLEYSVFFTDEELGSDVIESQLRMHVLVDDGFPNN